jgi:5-methylcytosine-specific restriction endonuclease McrA
MPAAYELSLPGEQIPDQFKLGVLCKRQHDWTGHGESLRYNKAKAPCVLCARIDALDRQAKRRAADPEGENAKAAAYKRRTRADGRDGRSVHGLPYRLLADNGLISGQGRAVATLLADGWDLPQIKQQLALETALRSLMPSPSVPRLVYQQQLERWRHHPDEKRKHISQWRAHLYAWRYMCDPVFRRHECQRNSERKAKNRGNHTVRLGSKATAARFAQFNNSCAYCGSTDNLIVEHFIPRSKGGPHALGNILPACQRCNVSKTAHDPEQWYRGQPFFKQARWRKILAVLGKAKVPVHQLPLL